MLKLITMFMTGLAVSIVLMAVVFVLVFLFAPLGESWGMYG